MISIRAFYCPISENRTHIRSGIVIYPLPEANYILRGHIQSALKNIIDELLREEHHRG